MADCNNAFSYPNEKPGAWATGCEEKPVATEVVQAHQRPSSSICLFQLFILLPLSLLLPTIWTQGERRILSVNEAGAEMLTHAATVSGLHERTDGWGCETLVHLCHLYPHRPRCVTTAVPAFGKLVMDWESRGRRKEPQPQREDEEPRGRPCQEFCVCHINANEGQEISTDIFSCGKKVFFISTGSLGSQDIGCLGWIMEMTLWESRTCRKSRCFSMDC